MYISTQQATQLIIMYP